MFDVQTPTREISCRSPGLGVPSGNGVLEQIHHLYLDCFPSCKPPLQLGFPPFIRADFPSSKLLAMEHPPFIWPHSSIDTSIFPWDFPGDFPQGPTTHPTTPRCRRVARSCAGADRLSSGMRGAFGKPYGTAARVDIGQVLISVRTKDRDETWGTTEGKRKG